ncbi:hypothetical protein GCM10027080_05750 [Pedococcus soli]
MAGGWRGGAPFDVNRTKRPQNGCGDSAAVRELGAMKALLEPMANTPDMALVKGYVDKRLQAHSHG